MPEFITPICNSLRGIFFRCSAGITTWGMENRTGSPFAT
jgi:hypothetical protein